MDSDLPAGNPTPNELDPTTEADLNALLAYVRADGRICPQPQAWAKLWEMLPNRWRVGQGWIPPQPYILSAWWYTPLLPKILVFQEQVRYAAENGALDAVGVYLRGLTTDEWFYG